LTFLMLKAITDKSYEIFGCYNPGRPLDICTECCMTPEDESRLAGMRVQDIPVQLLSDYNDGGELSLLYEIMGNG
ncbi:MAG: hypothetical protein ACKOZV_02415, partial [Bacteroidota bacterium]